MKKSIVLTMTLALGLSVAPVSSSNQVEAAPKEITYKTCKALNGDYKSGVRVDKTKKNAVTNRTTKKTTYKTSNAHVSASLYKLNVKLDNDKDGIACEK